MTSQRIRNLAGQRFGKLVATDVSGKNNVGATTWNCQCDCGKTTTATLANLVFGNTKSCGCLKRTSKRRHNLSGQRFGLLIALHPIDPLRWMCQCDCGKTSIVRTVHLTRTHTRSCGCLAISPNPTEAQLDRRERNHAARWAKDVVIDAQQRCDACGSTEILHAHHIMPWDAFPEMRVNPENGACLCAACHRQVHRLIRTSRSPGHALATHILKHQLIALEQHE